MSEVIKKFGHKLRVRVCGLYTIDNKILLINHRGLNEENTFWAPPGGGVEFGESTIEALKREFKEETGLNVVDATFKFVYEFRNENFHAIELFFSIKKVSGGLSQGIDPELDSGNQIIEAVKFVSFPELAVMNKRVKHGMFDRILSLQDIENYNGYFFENLE